MVTGTFERSGPGAGLDSEHRFGPSLHPLGDLFHAFVIGFREFTVGVGADVGQKVARPRRGALANSARNQPAGL